MFFLISFVETAQQSTFLFLKQPSSIIIKKKLSLDFGYIKRFRVVAK